MTEAEVTSTLKDKLESKFVEMFKRATLNLGDCEVYLEAKQLIDFCRAIRVDSELSFDLLVSISAVDYLDSEFMSALRAGEGRYEVVYQLLSLQHKHRLRIKVSLPEQNPEVASIVSIWRGAGFMEREVFDMYGIRFSGHPDLRRVLMYDEFQGHPLRKDYPVLGKQPRVVLRHPEVHNTAKDMRRAPLIQINQRNLKTGVSK